MVQRTLKYAKLSFLDLVNQNNNTAVLDIDRFATLGFFNATTTKNKLRC